MDNGTTDDHEVASLLSSINADSMFCDWAEALDNCRKLEGLIENRLRGVGPIRGGLKEEFNKAMQIIFESKK